MLKILIGDLTVFTVITINSLVLLLTEVALARQFAYGIFPYAATTFDMLFPLLDNSG